MCIDSWDDGSDYGCDLDAQNGCLYDYWTQEGDIDAICECVIPQCSDQSTWSPSVEEICDGCIALVKGSEDSCDEFCQNQGLNCTAAWEEDDNDCVPLYVSTCSANLGFFSISFMHTHPCVVKR